MKSRLATGYKRKSGAFDVQGYMQIGAYWPAGGMASTATDMARWMRFHLNGGELEGVRLLDVDTHAHMWTRGFDDRPEAVDVAHGFQDRPYRGIRTFGHGGGTAAYLTLTVMAPELGLGIFLSYNSAHTSAPFRMLPDLADTYVGNRRVFSSFAAVFGLMNTVTVTPMMADAIGLASGGQTTYLRHRRPGCEHGRVRYQPHVGVLSQHGHAVYPLRRLVGGRCRGPDSAVPMAGLVGFGLGCVQTTALCPVCPGDAVSCPDVVAVARHRCAGGLIGTGSTPMNQSACSRTGLGGSAVIFTQDPPATSPGGAIQKIAMMTPANTKDDNAALPSPR